MSKQINSTKTNSTLNHSILNRTFFSFILLLSLTLTTQSFFSDSSLLNSNIQVLGEQTPQVVTITPSLITDQINEQLEQLDFLKKDCKHCIQSKHIQNNSISSNKIKNKSILSSDIASNQINSRTIEDLSIQEEDLTPSLQSTINQAPLFSNWNKQDGITIQESQISDLQSYLTSYSETDPIFSIHSASGITSTNITNWNTAYSWGNHAIQNYITDGNTNWNNEYNFITASTSDTLTNKSGNISMWTNNSNYITDGNTNWNNEYSFITNLSSFTTDNLNQGITNKYTQWTTNGTTLSYSNNVGIGTTTPTESLHLSGNIRSNNYIGSGNRCVYVDLNGVLRVKSEDCGTSSGGDNLGNHTLTQNIIMGNNWISGDGDNEGFQISSTGILSGAQGNISMWTNDSSYITDGNTNWNNEYSFITASTTDTLTNKSGNISMWTNNSGYLTSYTETDPIFTAHQANNITASHLTILGNTSNTNTGDETTSSIKTKLGTSSTSTDGYLTSTDWNIFNNKQPSGSYLTSYTETDPIYSAWNKSTGISITESQISNLQSYITDGNTNWNNSYGFIADLSTFTTDNLTQGTTNLYSQWATSGANISFNGGNIGIGTTSPIKKLEIAGDVLIAGGAKDSLVISSSIGETSATLFEIRNLENYASDRYLARFWSDYDNNGSGIIERFSVATDGTTYINGNVGIGITTPIDLLHLEFSGASHRGIMIKGTGTSSYPQLTMDRPSNTRSSTVIYSTAGTTNWVAGTLYNSGVSNSAYSISPDDNLANSKLVISTAGNLGIGTASPASSLHIVANDPVLRVDDTDSINRKSWISLTTAGGTWSLMNGGVGGDSDFHIYHGTLARDYLFIQRNSGNVGIGTTAPASLFNILGSTSSAGGALGSMAPQQIIMGGNANNRMELGMDNSGAIAIAFIQSRNTVTGAAHLSLNPGGGNVGIGTTSPGAKLQISATGNTGINTGEIVKIVSSGTSNWGSVHFTDNVTADAFIGFIPGTSAATRLLGFANNSSTSQMVIDGSGNVGIGTTSPSARLNVATSGGSGTLTALLGDSFTNLGLNFRANSTNYEIQSSLYNDETNEYPLVINPDGGNVGIGTTSPDYALRVQSGAVAGNGAYVNLASHSTKKENFEEVSVLEIISQLNIKEWQYKPEYALGDNTRHLYPFADDFFNKFGLGKDQWRITAEDMAGVALKGIQELEIKKADLSLIEINQTDINQNFNLLEGRIEALEEWIPAFARMTSDIETIENNLSQLTINTQQLTTDYTNLELRVLTLETILAGMETSFELPEEFQILQSALLENKIEFDAEGNLKVKKINAGLLQLDENENPPICGDKYKGAMYFDTEKAVFYGCDGIIWQKMQFAPEDITETP